MDPSTRDPRTRGSCRDLDEEGPGGYGSVSTLVRRVPDWDLRPRGRSLERLPYLTVLESVVGVRHRSSRRRGCDRIPILSEMSGGRVVEGHTPLTRGVVRLGSISDLTGSGSGILIYFSTRTVAAILLTGSFHFTGGFSVSLLT